MIIKIHKHERSLLRNNSNYEGMIQCMTNIIDLRKSKEQDWVG